MRTPDERLAADRVEARRLLPLEVELPSWLFDV